LATPQY